MMEMDNQVEASYHFFSLPLILYVLQDARD